MAGQVVLNRGTAPDDAGADSIYTGIGQINAMMTEIYTAIGENIVHYGAVGDYSPATDAGTDDTTAIQNALQAAVTKSGIVIVPAGAYYKITDTLDIPNGVAMVGTGFLHGSGNSGAPAIIIWRGSAGGIMMQVGTGVGGNYSFPITNIHLVGGRDFSTISSWAGTGIKFMNAADTGTNWRDLWISYINGNAIEFHGGITNGIIEGGRWDRIAGYAVYYDLTSYNVTHQIHDVTYDNWDNSMGSPFSQGFMFINGEAASSTFAMLHLTGIHTEINGPLVDTYAAGATTADKKGCYRIGVPASGANINVAIEMQSIAHSAASGISSHSFFQVTSASATLAQHMDRISIRLTQGRTVARQPSGAGDATNVVKLLGNVPTDYEYQFPTRINVAEFVRCGGPVDSERPTIDVRTNIAPHYHSMAMRSMAFADLPTIAVTEGTRAFCTDVTTATFGTTVAGGGSNNCPVYWDGSAWKAG